MVSRCCFSLQFPNDIGPTSILICHLYIFFGEMFVKVFDPFLIQLFVFLLLSLISLYIFNNSPLSDVYFSILCPNLWLLLFS